MLIKKRCVMGLFGFGSKKKAPEQQPMPSQNQNMQMQQSLPADLPPLPPLPPSDDLNADIAQQLARLQGTSPSPAMPIDDGSKKLDLNPDKRENFDWSSPVDAHGNANGSPGSADADADSGNAENAEKDAEYNEQEPLSPQPQLQEYDPYHEQKIEPPSPEDFGLRATGERTERQPTDTERNAEEMINIELPEFDAGLAEKPKPKRQEPAKAPEMPERQERQKPSVFSEHGDMEGRVSALPSGRMETAIDIFVNVHDYATVISDMEESKKRLNARGTALNQLLELQENEHTMLNEFHSITESAQKALMKTDRILFEKS